MAQLLASTIDGNLTVNGLATFSDGASTRQGLNYIGHNPVNLNTDTIETWRNFGTGTAYVNQDGLLNHQPHTYGFIENNVSSTGVVHQIFKSIGTMQGMWIRSGEGNAWYNSTSKWVEVPTGQTIKKQLWTGSWYSGSKTIPESDRYTMFLVAMNNQGTYIPVFTTGEYVRGIGGYVTSDTYDYSFQFYATISGTTWTLVNCDYLYHGASSTHGARTKCGSSTFQISSIYGIV